MAILRSCDVLYESQVQWYLKVPIIEFVQSSSYWIPIHPS